MFHPAFILYVEVLLAHLWWHPVHGYWLFCLYALPLPVMSDSQVQAIEELDEFYKAVDRALVAYWRSKIWCHSKLWHQWDPYAKGAWSIVQQAEQSLQVHSVIEHPVWQTLWPKRWDPSDSSVPSWCMYDLAFYFIYVCFYVFCSDISTACFLFVILVPTSWKFHRLGCPRQGHNSSGWWKPSFHRYH